MKNIFAGILLIALGYGFIWAVGQIGSWIWGF
jgi:hypothetical protein